MADGPCEDLPDVRIVEVGLSQMDVIRSLNEVIFEEERVINTLERDDLLILLAYVGDEPIGFKIGYRESRFVFYSAKGGVLSEYRRCGIARKLLDEMLRRAREKGYVRFAFDTFPNRHPGMAVLALTEGFRLTKADYNALYKDYRLRFEKKL
ncbi:MAG TPA: GNAT family N-acetyltransferase [Rhodothermales bacterium]|nr:GNAT family N-acetyltransferase [Rhodothermales bacterium]